MSNRQLLNMQADKLEMLFSSRHIPLRVYGGKDSSTFTRFGISIPANVNISQIERLNREIAISLGAKSARVVHENGALAIEVSKSGVPNIELAELTRELVAIPNLKSLMEKPGTALLGVGTDGVPLLLRLVSPDVAHVLIAGTTGSGKTELARSMIASMIQFQKPRDIGFVIIDPKGGRKFDIPKQFLLKDVSKNVRDGLFALDFVVEQMELRQRKDVSKPLVVFVIDELADLAQTGGDEFVTRMERVLQRGRSAGISVIACTQKPSADAIKSTLMKANFPVRIVGKVGSAVDSVVAAGMGMVGAEKLNGRGDFILVAGGQSIRFQAAKGD
jgi:S-DNA-T family DNA segregation ATPase FtsK/SpoIIIE